MQTKAPLITDYDMQIMSGLGVSNIQLRRLLNGAGIAPSLRLASERKQSTNPLSAKEIAVLKKGGAKGLDQSPQPEITAGAIKLLGELVEECRALVGSSLNLESVATLLKISSLEAKQRALCSPPMLHAFALADGQIRFPRWQFMDSETIPHLESILALIGKSITPLALSRFMLLPNPDLEGQSGAVCARDWLISTGNPEPVLELARFRISD
ncbi:hypothetical protein ABWH88_09960 [Marinobacter adhaerens]|uniref:Uncharacterized protein n=2 Tax=Marinobacter adhaerens TaxID=1033846 RepID=A0ABX8IJU5_9GAMM|nr:hypothetical protein [Marinobacter adhaerens]QWV13885.1 hypothetical protein KQ249_04485 [Marinobacter adhaerens]